MLKWLCILSLSLDVCLCGNIAPVALVPVGAKTSNSSENTKIVGGYNARLGDAPWQVGLFDEDGDCYCGGTLLSPHVVVTAAHCMYDYPNTYTPPHTIRLGGLDKTKLPLKYTAKQIFVHRYYDELNDFDMNNDIALIILNGNISIDSLNYVEPANLPNGNDVDTDFENKNVLISGWGSITPRILSKVYPTLLQAALVKIFQKGVCKNLYNGWVYTDNMICAGVADYSKDACQGDSGGPLVLKGRNVLVGITSWGEGCARKNYPGVYTKVTKYVDWIKEKAEEGNAPLSSTMNNPSIIIISGFILMHVFLSLSRR